MTTLTFSESFTTPVLSARSTTALTMSPIRAIFLFDPGMPITFKARAPELSATFKTVLRCSFVCLAHLTGLLLLLSSAWFWREVYIRKIQQRLRLLLQLRREPGNAWFFWFFSRRAGVP